jgi:hypothetical protein
MPVLRRTGPALLLVALAPVVAEFLLGDFSIRSLPLAIVFLPQYGGGALLIREVTRRTGRGWPTMVLLGAAYALIEEGLTTQSLFNPNYIGLRLLDYGYIPALGTSPDWTLFVLSIHVVWSISTPILIAEGISGTRRTTPWLGRIGLAVTAILFGLGCVSTTVFSFMSSHFLASAPQLLTIVLLVILAVLAAFVAFRPGERREQGAAPPPPWLVAAASLVLSTAFELAFHLGEGLRLPPAVPLAAMLACELVGIALVARWSRREGWDPHHLLAIATGTVLTYSWVGLSAFLRGHTNVGGHVDAVDIVGQILEIVAILGLVGWGVLRNQRAAAGRAAGSATA